MPLRPPRRRSLALGLAAACLATACTSPAEHRQAIETIDGAWITDLPEDSLEEMTEHVRALGELEPASPEALVSLPLLTRQALESESAWIRSEALRSAWRLAAPIPVAPMTPNEEPAVEFNGWMERFETLDAAPDLRQGEEIVALATRIGGYRFAPEQMRYAIELAAVTTVRGYLRRQSPVQTAFAAQAPGACRHALVLVTLQAGDDDAPFVREEALRAVRHLPSGVALQRMIATITRETDGAVLLALLDSVADLARRVGVEPVTDLLRYAERSSDAAVRRRATALIEEFEA